MNQDKKQIEIETKLQKLFKSQDALCPPTFAQSTIDKMNIIFVELQQFQSSDQFSHIPTADILKFYSQVVTKISLIIYPNNLPITYLNFSTLISSAFHECITVEEKISKRSLDSGSIQTFSKMILNFKNTMPKIMTANCHKSPSGLFQSILHSLHSIETDLTTIMQKSDISSHFTDGQQVIKNIFEAENVCSHLAKATTFIYICESLQSNLRKLSINPSPNNPVEIRVIPTMPCLHSSLTKDQLSEKTGSELKDAVQKELAIDHQLPYLINLSELIYYFSLPTNPHCQNTFSNLHRSIFDFQKTLFDLPDTVTSSRELHDLKKNTQQLCTNINSAFSELKGTSPKIRKQILKNIDIFSVFNSNLNHFLSVADIAFAKGPIKISTSSFKPIQVSSCFEIPIIPKQKNVQKFNAIRGFASTAYLLSQLSQKKIKLGSCQKLALHPADFSSVLERIRQAGSQFESGLFHLSVNVIGEYPNAKTGINILSNFTQIYKLIDQYPLFMDQSLIGVTLFKSMAISYLLAGVPLEQASQLDTISKEILTILQAYQVYHTFHHIGAISLTFAAHLSYMLTMCQVISDVIPSFKQFVAKIKSINLLDFNIEEIQAVVAALKINVIKEIDSWSYKPIMDQFSDVCKVIINYSTVLRKVVNNDPTFLKLLSQLTSWLVNLGRTTPKGSIVTEMEIKMMAVKQCIKKCLTNNPKSFEKIDIDRYIDCLDNFARLRNLFIAKRRMKALLSALERTTLSEKIKKPHEAPKHQKKTPSKKVAAKTALEHFIQNNQIEQHFEEPALPRDFSVVFQNHPSELTRDAILKMMNNKKAKGTENSFSKAIEKLKEAMKYNPEFQTPSDAISLFDYVASKYNDETELFEWSRDLLWSCFKEFLQSNYHNLQIHTNAIKSMINVFPKNHSLLSFEVQHALNSADHAIQLPHIAHVCKRSFALFDLEGNVTEICTPFLNICDVFSALPPNSTNVAKLLQSSFFDTIAKLMIVTSDIGDNDTDFDKVIKLFRKLRKELKEAPGRLPMDQFIDFIQNIREVRAIYDICDLLTTIDSDVSRQSIRVKQLAFALEDGDAEGLLHAVRRLPAEYGIIDLSPIKEEYRKVKEIKEDMKSLWNEVLVGLSEKYAQSDIQEFQFFIGFVREAVFKHDIEMLLKIRLAMIYIEFQRMGDTTSFVHIYMTIDKIVHFNKFVSLWTKIGTVLEMKPPKVIDFLNEEVMLKDEPEVQEPPRLLPAKHVEIQSIIQAYADANERASESLVDVEMLKKQVKKMRPKVAVMQKASEIADSILSSSHNHTTETKKPTIFIPEISSYQKVYQAGTRALNKMVDFGALFEDNDILQRDPTVAEEASACMDILVSLKGVCK